MASITLPFRSESVPGEVLFVQRPCVRGSLGTPGSPPWSHGKCFEKSSPLAHSLAQKKDSSPENPFPLLRGNIDSSLFPLIIALCEDVSTCEKSLCFGYTVYPALNKAAYYQIDGIEGLLRHRNTGVDERVLRVSEGGRVAFIAILGSNHWDILIYTSSRTYSRIACS